MSKVSPKERSRLWRIENAERHRRYTAEWRRANRERALETQRLWREANREKAREVSRKWYAENKQLTIQRAVEYQVRKKSATLGPDPRIDALYEIATWLRSKGDDVHVDHIIPLKPSDPNAAVGLHVYTNLQILPAIENLKKGNR